MFTRMLSLYGKSVKKKEKEFLKTIGKEKVVKEYKQQQQVPDFELMGKNYFFHFFKRPLGGIKD